MKEKIEQLIRKLEYQLQGFRRSQLASRDEKKKLYWLGQANATQEHIVDLKTLLPKIQP